MEEIQQPATTGSSGCINCNNPVIVKGYPNALCESCRENFIKFPIPKSIILFAAAIGIIFLFSIYKIPKDILLGIHLDKGNTALLQKRYLTAQKELQKVVDKVPDNIEAKSNLLIAAFYNEDFTTFSKMFAQLTGKNYDDMELYNRVDNTVKEADNYFPNDSFISLQHRYNDDATKIPDTVLKNYISQNRGELYPAMLLANRLLDAKALDAADSVINNILMVNPSHIPALAMMAVLKREEDKTDESLAYCDKVLAINKESVYALSAKARTYMKQKKDAEALSLALSCHQMDENNYYATGTLILAYHFTNKLKERDGLLNTMSLLKDSASVQTMQYVRDVISGKEIFRN